MYYQGDYYRGDPGIFSAIGGVLKGAVKIGTGIAGELLPGPFGTVARAGRKMIFPGTRTVTPPAPMRYAPSMPMVPQPVAPSPTGYTATGQPKKRRRMNVGNAKALRRAIRREQGFVKLARRALRGTGYSVVTKASRSRRVNVREAGAGSVTVH